MFASEVFCSTCVKRSTD